MEKTIDLFEEMAAIFERSGYKLSPEIKESLLPFLEKGDFAGARAQLEERIKRLEA